MKTGFRCNGVYAKNQVVNYPVQGAAFHCLLWVLIRLVEELRSWRSKVIGEIHDSALIDVHPEELEDVLTLAKRLCMVDLLKEWDWIIVPLKVEVATSEIDGNWSEMKVRGN